MLISECQVVTKMNIFREETTSALVGFHVGRLSWLNWSSEMLVLWRENPQSKARTNKKLKPHIALGWNGARATLVGRVNTLTTEISKFLNQSEER